MSDGRRLSGVWPILVTPFDEAGELDVESLRLLVRGTLAVGADGAVALGVTAAPPPFARPGPALAEHYRTIGTGGLPGVGLAVMKEVLRRRGLIGHAGLRQPGPALDGVALRELERVLAGLPAVDEPLGAAR